VPKHLSVVHVLKFEFPTCYVTQASSCFRFR